MGLTTRNVRRTAGSHWLLAVFCACCLQAAPVIGQDLVLDFAAGHTAVEFTLEDPLHTVHGTFKLKRGEIHFDPASGAAGGEVVVDATSGESGTNARDRRMHKNVLESDRYPEIVFKPDRVEGKVGVTGTSQVQVHGVFKIHGAEHEMTIPASVEMRPDQVAASLHFEIPYVSWGMKDPSNFLLHVSNKVGIDIKTVAQISGTPGH